MSSILDSLKSYTGASWEVKCIVDFPKEDKDRIIEAVVTYAKYGNAVKLTYKNKRFKFIRLDQKSTLTLGESVDLDKVKIKIFSKEGEEDILRITNVF